MRLLDGPDLFHLEQERPGRPMHTLKVAVLAGRVPCDHVDAWARSTLSAVEPLRQRLARPPLARQVWIDAGEPDLAYHVQHVALAEPGGEAEFLAVLSELCSGAVLDRTRPLWRLWHISGLSGDRDAVVFQVHHVVADGNASVALWQAVADGAGSHPMPSGDAPPSRPAALVPGAVARGARELVRLPNQFRRFGKYLERARSLEGSGQPSVTRAFVGPATRFNVDPASERRCLFVTLPLTRLRDAAHAAEGTLNEVFLTLCGGALRRHLEALGDDLPLGLTATVPGALPERRHTYGNSVTTLYVSLHSDIHDPLDRLAAVRRSLIANRRATEPDPRLLPDWQRYPRFNRWLINLMELAERRTGRPAFNLIVSSVRGPKPFSLAGVPVVELRSLGPLAARLGLNITGWSYGDDFVVGIHTYASAATDVERLGALLQVEMAELESSLSIRGATA